MRKKSLLTVLAVVVLLLGLTVSASFTSAAPGQPGQAADNAPKVTGWEQGKGWVGPWEPGDEVGALNGLNQAMVKNAIKTMVKEAKVYDLDPGRGPNMYLWPGHPPFMNMTFRTPSGIRAQGDMPFTDPPVNPQQEYWISEATIGTQHTGSHVDSLAHLTTREYPGKPETDDYWYNGFDATTYLGDFGPTKADIASMPPVITRGVLLDVYGYFQSVGKANLLTKGYEITQQDMEETLAWEGVDIEPGDAVLIRSGLLRFWDLEDPVKNKEQLAMHDGAGPGVPGAKWLVGEKGAVFLGADTAALEVQPNQDPNLSFNPVHIYLLIEQGVHIGELFYLENLAADKVYEFLFVISPNRIHGGTGSMSRPLAIR